MAQPGALRHRRKREQEKQFAQCGDADDCSIRPGLQRPLRTALRSTSAIVVTIRGANGYTATGQASFFVPTEDSDSNRDELDYQSDYGFAHYLTRALRLPL